MKTYIVGQVLSLFLLVILLIPSEHSTTSIQYILVPVRVSLSKFLFELIHISKNVLYNHKLFPTVQCHFILILHTDNNILYFYNVKPLWVGTWGLE
jgi:hypothetical protein